MPSAAGLLVVLGRRGARVAVLTPELRVVAVAYDVLVPELLEPEAAAEVRALEAELAALGVPAARRAKAMYALADDRLGARRAVSAWVLRTAPHAPLRQHLREAGVFGVLGARSSGCWCRSRRRSWSGRRRWDGGRSRRRTRGASTCSVRSR